MVDEAATSEPVRSFIAIEIPSAVQRALTDLAAALRAEGVRARWVPETNYHLSIRFLDAISSEQRAAIESAFAVECATIAPFKLQVCGCGAFFSRRIPRVLWAGVSGEIEPLRALAAAAEAIARDVGGAALKTDYHPHITLGRIRAARDATDIEHALKRHEEFDGGAIPVDRVSLFRSELHPSGAQYTRLHTFALAETE